MIHSETFSQRVARRRVVWLLAIALCSIALDQGTKIWAQKTLAQPIQTVVRVDKPGGGTEWRPLVQHVGTRTIVVIPNAFNLIYKENPAAAFSLTSSLPDWFRRPFLMVVSLLAIIFFIIWYLRIKEPDALLMLSFCSIVGGAIGNLIDRIRLGYVIDFLDCYAGFLGYPNAIWPTFNVADSCIVVGAIGVVIHALFFQKKT